MENTKPTDVVTPTSVTGLVAAFVAATLTMLSAFGLNLTPEQQSSVQLWIIGTMALILFIVSYVAKQRAIAKTKVVEMTTDGQTVVAGPANELTTGKLIRDNLGDLASENQAPASPAAANSPHIAD